MSLLLPAESGPAIAVSGGDIFSRNTVAFLWALVRRQRAAESGHDLAKSAEYVLRLLPFLPWVQRLKALFSAPRLQALLLAQPSLLDKLRRPYHDRRLGVGQRLQLLQDHYHWLLEQFSPEGQGALYGPGGQLVVDLTDDPAGFSIRLLVDRRFEKEGELTLVLQSATGQRVGNLAFTISGDFFQGRIMRIACLQGERQTGGDLYRQLTRDCHGLHPLALLACAAQWLACAWDLRAIYAVGGDEHVLRHWRYRSASAPCVSRSYDELWRQLGGCDIGGWYELPVAPLARHPLSEPASERAMDRRREFLVADIREQIRGYVAAEAHAVPIASRYLAEA